PEDKVTNVFGENVSKDDSAKSPAEKSNDAANEKPVVTKVSGELPKVDALPANPKAADILDRMADRYKAIKTLKLDASLVITTVDRGKTDKDSGQVVIHYSKPDKLKVVTGRDKKSETIVSDGKTLYQYSSANNVYHKQESPKDLFKVDKEGQLISINSLLAGADIAPAAKKAKLLPMEKIAGVDTYVIEFNIVQTPGGSTVKEKIWVGKDDLLLHQMEVSHLVSVKDQMERYNQLVENLRKQGEAIGQSPDLTNIPKPNKPATRVERTIIKSVAINKPIPASTYTFTPPKGAKTVEQAQQEYREQMEKMQSEMKKQIEEMQKKDLVGKAAPAFSMAALDGKKVSLSSLKGSPVVVFFWSSDSSDSVSMLASIQKLQQTAGVKAVGMALDVNKSAVQKIVKDKGITFPVLMDMQNMPQVMMDYGLPEPPTAFVIDKNGVVKSEINGVKSADELKAKLDSLGIN
ncbi:MAG TPA: redoxin domain-containing protein, partial [Armatimonadota bacterium]|nr:redoxin domain-containing protein [Armatimonadota bacterium]